MKFKKWQKLNQYFELGVFNFIDLAFAESVLKKIDSDKEEHAALLATLFALSRQGHLTLDLSECALDFTLQSLTVIDVDSLKGLLHSGAATFPSLAEVKNREDLPQAWICRSGSRYYLQKNWIYESEILKHLERLSKQPPTICLSLPTADSLLNAAQKKGVENAIVNSLSLLTGGPGTGKTFTAAELVKACLISLPEKQHPLRIILTAPTGKAVAQLEGNLKNTLNCAASIRAGTLHALLGIKAHAYEEEEPPLLLADLIIVDECSMIDARIFSHLLASIPNGARLVLIGDKDQLPPIEAGSIFADLIDADVYPSASLTECLRSDRSEILTLSHHIKRGDPSAAIDFLKENPDIRWIDLDEIEVKPAQLCMSLWEQYKERFVSFYLEKPLAEQILNLLGRFSLLSSMRQGPLGVDAINQYFLYQSIQQVPQDAWWIAPIMVVRNDYEMQLYNGDLGFLVRKFTSDFSLRQFHIEDYVLFHDRKGGFKQIAALNLKSFEYSYCLSVHKSQGSEYDEALILIAPGSELFGREVLYTAITRARHRVALMCSQALFIRAIGNSSRKTSGLVARLNTNPRK